MRPQVGKNCVKDTTEEDLLAGITAYKHVLIIDRRCGDFLHASLICPTII